VANSEECELLRKTLSTGEYLFREGDAPDSAYLIEEGSVEIVSGSPEHPLLLARLGPGDLIGEMAVVDKSPRSASALATANCVLLVIDSEQIADRLASSDPIVRMLLQGQMKRYRSMLALLRGRRADGSLPVPTVDTGDGEPAPGLSKFRLENQLRQALSEQRLEVRYQPVLEVASGRIAGYEALVRWEHPVRGHVSPAEFIALAEETSLIVPVGEYVFDAACAALDAFRANAISGSEMPFIAVNVSARQLAHAGLIKRVVERREALGLPRGCIKVEITESQALDYRQVIDVIAHCHAQDIPIALDDFGTGYSHLTHLHQLEFDTIKVDQSFVRDMFSSERAMAIVRTIVNMGHALHADLVVEGVETRQQLDALRELGCRYVQGYLIGKAMPLEEHLVQRNDAVRRAWSDSSGMP
jgi:EAL domain-containing protein (putative c-di-GMP-specific phosphodiesterase class I)